MLKVEAGQTDVERSELYSGREPRIGDVGWGFAKAGLHVDRGTEREEEPESRLDAAMPKVVMVTCISAESVRLLKKNKLKPRQVQSGCIPERTPEFIKRWEAILGRSQAKRSFLMKKLSGTGTQYRPVASQAWLGSATG